MKCNFNNKINRNMGGVRMNNIEIGRGKIFQYLIKHYNLRCQKTYRRCYK